MYISSSSPPPPPQPSLRLPFHLALSPPRVLASSAKSHSHRFQKTLPPLSECSAVRSITPFYHHLWPRTHFDSLSLHLPLHMQFDKQIQIALQRIEYFGFAKCSLQANSLYLHTMWDMSRAFRTKARGKFKAHEKCCACKFICTHLFGLFFFKSILI